MDADGEGRTTATLVASLAARLGALHCISGSDAIGSLAAGFAALGREVSRTAEGAALRRAIAVDLAGMNGNTLWSALRMEEWVSSAAPSRVLDQLRNDLALLLATDLEETLALMPIPGQAAGAQVDAERGPATFLDCTLGLWAFSRELMRAVEALAAPHRTAAGAVVPGAEPERGGPLLR
ncbi:MAG: hypothetical protein JOZ15_12375 [Acidobacteria bacterium]|nr:hypothetical protein [Acidobacteriota bacterium]